jgi:hypothetical protein
LVVEMVVVAFVDSFVVASFVEHFVSSYIVAFSYQLFVEFGINLILVLQFI